MRALFLCFLLLTCAFAQEKTENTIDRESSALGFVAFPRVFDGTLVDHLETPVQFHAILYLNFAAWNGWCNYHPTAADIFGRTRFKRPVAEHTRENKNIAQLYSMWRLLQSSPHSFGLDTAVPLYREVLTDMGLDPDDTSTDMTTAIGIGNRAGFDTARLMNIDGWNTEGDLTATQDNYKQPFQDYTGYTPRNDPWNIRFPFKWQPLLENNGRGFYFRQEHVTPYAGSAIAFSLTPDEVRKRKLPALYRKSNEKASRLSSKDLKALRKSARAVFRVSKRLTEKQRLFAELFDNKAKAFRTAEDPFGVGSIATAIRFFILGPALDWDLDEEMIYGVGANIATFDSMVTAWKEKVRQDAVRPTGQTMQFLFGDKKFKVWGGPGRRPVRITAAEWQPYIRTMPHSEYPSGSSCACSTLVEHALINTKNKDKFPFTFTIPKGSSRFYPGQVPENDVEIKINRLTQWSRLCGQSRIWSGVHFKPSVAGGERLCKGIGRSAQKLMDGLVKGELDPKWLQWLPRDVERFWEEP